MDPTALPASAVSKSCPRSPRCWNRGIILADVIVIGIEYIMVDGSLFATLPDDTVYMCKNTEPTVLPKHEPPHTIMESHKPRLFESSVCPKRIPS
jgi:hypothetical protein